MRASKIEGIYGLWLFWCRRLVFAKLSWDGFWKVATVDSVVAFGAVDYYRGLWTCSVHVLSYIISSFSPNVFT
jgi:hypothetical protein